ncbi:MAG: amino acid ABC transporter substrate-binding protein [Deltaproteobacteria bacterium]|nr:amino acid ABC transporter substrate-binding protein [Deltaproteobacteria bacterium]
MNRPLLLGVLLAAGLAPSGANEARAQPAARAVGASPAAPEVADVPGLPPAAGENPRVYANTPDELRPYSRFVQQPYSRFFVDELVHTGPGRSKPDPVLDRVRIGLIAPLESTHEAYLGQDILHGTQLAIADANAEGGWHGKPFELVVRNDLGRWGATANEVIQLAYDEQVRLILGSVDGANTHIAIRVALKVEIPMINTGDLDPTLVETKIPWVFRVVGDDRQAAYTLAFYLYRQLGLSKVAILRANNRYGRFGVAEFIASSVRLQRPAPLEVNYEVSWEQTNSDFAMQLARLRQVEHQALVLWADARPAGRIVRLLRAAGNDVPVYACDRVIHPDFFAEAGAHAEGVVAVSPYDPASQPPGLAELERRYGERFGREPSHYALHAYDGAWLGIAAIRKAGLSWARIRDAIGELAPFQGVTGEIAFDGSLSNRRRMTLATARGGRFVFGEPQAEQRF